MILIINNYDSFTYNLYQIVAQSDYEIHVVRNDKITLQKIHEMAPLGIILSPGPGRPEDSGICIDLIKEIISKKLRSALLGVCLGHQAITVACGGKVIQANEIVHGKDDLIFHQGNNIYVDLPLPFRAGRYHSLIAEKNTLPNDLIVDAENNSGTVMGIRHAELPIYGVQFHPESILTPSGNNLVKNFINISETYNEHTTSH